MSTAIRLAAECAGDSADETMTLVLDAVLEANVIKKQLCFGVVSSKEAGSRKRWPIILRPDEQRSDKWVIDFGTDSNDSPQPTNIVEKEIRAGNYFTIWDGSDELTLRITTVDEL